MEHNLRLASKVQYAFTVMHRLRVLKPTNRSHKQSVIVVNYRALTAVFRLLASLFVHANRSKKGRTSGNLEGRQPVVVLKLPKRTTATPSGRDPKEKKTLKLHGMLPTHPHHNTHGICIFYTHFYEDRNAQSSIIVIN